jgi:hypothetical protein
LTAVGENNANLISYSEYKKLADQNVKCAVYDYNSCDYNGDHEETIEVNACVSLCHKCGATIVAHSKEAELKESIEYTDYLADGTKTVMCTNEGCTYNITEKAPALFTCLGYSVGPDGYTLKAGFKVNNYAVEDYKEFYPDFTFGIVMANANTVASTQGFFVDGSLNTSAKGFMVSIESLKYVNWNADIAGFDANIANSLELVVGIYTDDGEGNVSVIQYVDADKYTTTKTYADMSLNAITFNQVRVGHGMDALVPQPAPVGDEQ